MKSCKSRMILLSFSTYLLRSFNDERNFFFTSIRYSSFHKSVSAKSMVPTFGGRKSYTLNICFYKSNTLGLSASGWISRSFNVLVTEESFGHTGEEITLGLTWYLGNFGWLWTFTCRIRKKLALFLTYFLPYWSPVVFI